MSSPLQLAQFELGELWMKRLRQNVVMCKATIVNSALAGQVFFDTFNVFVR
jgi:hypothetical protein